MEVSRKKIDLQLARKCWTVQNLADAYGVSRARMNAILNQRRLSVLSVGRLAKALGVEPEAIIE